MMRDKGKNPAAFIRMSASQPPLTGAWSASPGIPASLHPGEGKHLRFRNARLEGFQLKGIFHGQSLGRGTRRPQLESAVLPVGWDTVVLTCVGGPDRYRDDPRSPVQSLRRKCVRIEFCKE
jgi:hypothetical protein